MTFAQAPQINEVELAATSVDQYEKLEAVVDLTATYDNPYDYDQITVQGRFTHPDGDELIVDGFYLQPYTPPNLSTGATSPMGEGEFSIRFAPPKAGIWSLEASVTTPDGTATTTAVSFEALPSTNPGFVRSSGTHYLQMDNGDPYIPIGENVAWHNSNPVVNYQVWLQGLRDFGGNFFRLWQCHWGLGLEWQGFGGYSGLKRYQQLNAAYTDWLFDYAAENGIYIMYALQHHGQVSSVVNPNWSESPYNAANGGPCENTYDFFTNDEARQLTKNRFRYVVARWGYARSIMAWELFNEVDWTNDFDTHSELVAEWHLEMAAYLKSIDPYQHLVTTSYAHSQNDAAVWSSPDIDLTQTHYYFDTPNLERTLTTGLRNYLEDYEKPSINGEFGITTSGNNLSSIDPDGIHIHNSIWGSFFGGGAGTAMSWWWDSYIEPQNLYYHFLPLADHVELVDWVGGQYRPADVQVGGPGADLVLTPSLGWGEESDNEITINNAGELSSAGAGLGFFLYGSQWNTQYRNPPTFIISTEITREFRVVTGSETGQNPILSISVDGNEVLSEAASTNQTYTVSIPPGTHEVLVDNTGTDWITIAAYQISELAAAVDAYVLRNNDGTGATGWLLNHAYNHQSVLENDLPDPAGGVTVQVDGMADGTYAVAYYDCITGAIVDQGGVQVSGGELLLLPPSIIWDLSFVVNTDPVQTQEPLSLALHSAEVYPNPVAQQQTSLQLNLEQSATLRVVLYDASGKRLDGLYSGQLTAGTQNLPLSLPAHLSTGTYWLEVSADAVNRTLPLVVVRS